MSAASDIYDYFTPIEEAIAARFTAANLTCYTALGLELLSAESTTSATGEQEFQKARPRVELVLQPGAAKGMLRAQADRKTTFGHMREKARMASLQMRIITAPQVVAHRAFVAQVLFLCDTLAADVNNTKSLTNHNLQSVRCSGGSVGYKPEDGDFETTLNFDVEFSVQEYAWDALDAELGQSQ